MPRHQHISRPVAALGVAVVASLSVAACGGSGQTAHPDASASASARSSGLHFAACVRAHGVPDFPDPGAGSSSAGSSITAAAGKVTVDGHVLSESHARVDAAISHCERSSTAGGVPVVHVTGAQAARIRAALVVFSACMRAHGVPSFQDMRVTFTAGRDHDGYSLIYGGNLRSEVSTPAFQSASRRCSPALTQSYPKHFGD